MFLMVIDMDDESAAQEPPQGFSIRAWYGIKLVSHILEITLVPLLKVATSVLAVLFRRHRWGILQRPKLPLRRI